MASFTTGSFENWAGTIADIGPIYPFVGTETILVIIGVVYWVVWHVWQLKDENKQLRDEDDKFSGR